MEPPNKGNYGANDFVPCREDVPISEVKQYTKYHGLKQVSFVECISMGLKQVSFVERSSLSRRSNNTVKY